MIHLLAAAALAAAPQDTVALAEVGPVREECENDIEEYGDGGFDAGELEVLANCIAYDSNDPISLERVDQGVALYRRAMELRGISETETPFVDEHRFQIMWAYATNGHSAAFRREAEAQAQFVESAPETRCQYFRRLEVDLRSGDNVTDADWLAQRFDLHRCKMYVPEDGWTSWDGQPWFYESWFGNQLSAMGEPPLADESDLAGFEHRFRLSVYPSFSPAYAVRLDQLGPEDIRLHWTVLDGAGGYAPGRVAASGERPLSRREIRRFRRLIEAASLASLPMEEPRQAPRSDGAITICADGTHYVFEELGAGGRSFVERSFCGRSDPELRDVIEAMTALLQAEARE